MISELQDKVFMHGGVKKEVTSTSYLITLFEKFQ
jgi:hypothetical protein